MEYIVDNHERPHWSVKKRGLGVRTSSSIHGVLYDFWNTWIAECDVWIQRRKLATRVLDVGTANLEDKIKRRQMDAAETMAQREREKKARGGKRVRPIDPATRCLMCGADGDRQCTGCKQLWYCSDRCRLRHWSDLGHQNECGKARDPPKEAKPLVDGKVQQMSCALCTQDAHVPCKNTNCVMRYCDEECAAMHRELGHTETCGDPPEKCPICFDYMDPPFELTPCNHRLCLDCLRNLLGGGYHEDGVGSIQLVSTSVPSSAELVCPVCRDPGLEYMAHGNSMAFAVGNMLMTKGAMFKGIGFAQQFSKTIFKKGSMLEKAAAKLFKETIAALPDHRFAHTNLGGCLTSSLNVVEAGEVLKIAVSRNPDDMKASYLLGSARMLANNPRDAVDPFRQAVKGGVLHNLGAAEFFKDYREGLQHALAGALSGGNRATFTQDLRFEVGDRVRCITAEGWLLGTVSMLWFRDLDWPEERAAVPYQVLLDDTEYLNNYLMAPHDDDDTVQRVLASGPPVRPTIHGATDSNCKTCGITLSNDKFLLPELQKQCHARECKRCADAESGLAISPEPQQLVAQYNALPVAKLAPSGWISTHVHLNFRELVGIAIDASPPPRMVFAVIVEAHGILFQLPLLDARPTARAVLPKLLQQLCTDVLNPTPGSPSSSMGMVRPVRITSPDWRVVQFLLRHVGGHGMEVCFLSEKATLITNSGTPPPDVHERSEPQPLNAIMDSVCGDANSIMIRQSNGQPMPACLGHHFAFRASTTKPGVYESTVRDTCDFVPEMLRFCCAPRCGKLALWSELTTCGGCGRPAYCNSKCQRQHWKGGHKNECKGRKKEGVAEVPPHGGSGAPGSAAGSNPGAPGDASGKASRGADAPKDKGATRPQKADAPAAHGNFKAGDVVELGCLTKTRLNGVRGHVVGDMSASGRWSVELLSGTTLAIRPGNLTRVSSMEVERDECPICLSLLPLVQRSGCHDDEECRSKTVQRLSHFPCCGGGVCFTCFTELAMSSIAAGNEQFHQARADMLNGRTPEHTLSLHQLLAGVCPLCRERQPDSTSDSTFMAHKIRLFKQRIKNGVRAADAHFRLGNMAEDDGRMEEAVIRYRRAADDGPEHSAFAERCLGNLFVEGRGVRKDCKQAFAYTERAANRGEPEAQFNLGCMHDFAQGVPPDSTKAMRMYRHAAEAGHPEARGNLAKLLLSSDNSPVDKQEAFKLWRTFRRSGRLQWRSSD